MKDFKKARDFNDLIWQIPLFGFLVYFTFIYLESDLWTWILSHFVFFFLFLLRVPLNQVLINKHEATSKSKYLKINKFIKNIMYWGTPAVFLFIFFKRWDNLGMVIFIGIIWLLLLIVYNTGQYLSLIHI